MKKTLPSVTRARNNIFADLGLAEADEHMLKARVVMFIGKMVEELDLTQQAAARRMGISQPDVSNMLRGRFENVSLERLLRCARALGTDVEIKMKRPVGRRKDHQHAGTLSLVMA